MQVADSPRFWTPKTKRQEPEQFDRQKHKSLVSHQKLTLEVRKKFFLLSALSLQDLPEQPRQSTVAGKDQKRDVKANWKRMLPELRLLSLVSKMSRFYRNSPWLSRRSQICVSFASSVSRRQCNLTVRVLIGSLEMSHPPFSVPDARRSIVVFVPWFPFQRICKASEGGFCGVLAFPSLSSTRINALFHSVCVCVCARVCVCLFACLFFRMSSVKIISRQT